MKSADFQTRFFLPICLFPIFVLIYLQYEYRVTLSPNELKINSKLGGKYVGQECGELCNPLLVRRKLLGKSCRDGCNVYIYFFYALQFFTSTFINFKRDKFVEFSLNDFNSSFEWVFELFFDYLQFVKVGPHLVR